MSHEISLDDLLDEWERRRDQGRPVSPEELCRDCPELLEPLRQQVARLQQMDRFLQGGATDDATLPSEGGPTPRWEVPREGPLPGGRYRPVQFHARGGLGEVFLARDEELLRDVALKRLHPQRAWSAELRARLQSEAEITGRLEHPGIVPVYGLGRLPDGQPVYAMRFIRGETLGAAIARFHAHYGAASDSGPRNLALQQLLRRFLSVCQTIAYAHSQHVVHRDLKPSNIMLGDYGETLVVDWGLAKHLPPAAGPGAASTPQAVPDAEAAPGGDAAAQGQHLKDDTTTSALVGPAPETHGSLAVPQVWESTSSHGASPAASAAAPGMHPRPGANTEPGSIHGTLQYMSPEQAAGATSQIGPHSDIYSLGATLYALLVGHSAFAGNDPAELLTRVRQGQFPPPRAVNPRVPAVLEAICLRAMARDPRDRYRSAQELADDLERYLADEPVQAWREPWAQRAWRFVRRHQVAVATAAAVLVVAAASFAVATGLLSAKNVQLAAAQRTTEEALQRQRQSLYVAYMNLAQRAADAGDMPRVVELLQALVPQGGSPDLRGFEWYHLWRQAHRDVQLRGHQRVVKSVVFAPHSRRLLTGSFDGTVRLWDDTGRLLRIVGQHQGPVMAVAVSPDEKMAASAGADGTVRLWSLPAGTAGASWTVGDVVTSVAFSGDGTLLAAGSDDDGVHLWDVPRGAALPPLRGHTSNVHRVVFVPGTQELASIGGDGTVRLWEPRSAQLLDVVEPEAGSLFGLAFSSDGSLMAVAGVDRRVYLWQRAARRGQTVWHPSARLAGHRERIEAVAFSPDGRWLYSCDEAGQLLWWQHRGENWQRQSDQHAHIGAIYALAVSGDGTLLATAGGDATVRLWNTATQRPLPVADGERMPETLTASASAVRALAFSAEGDWLFSGSASGRVTRWRMSDYWSENLPLPVEAATSAEVFGLAPAADGIALAAALGRWDAPGSVVQWTRQPAAGWQLNCVRPMALCPLSVDFSPEGGLLAAGGMDQRGVLWPASSAAEAPPQHTLAHRHWVYAVAFSPQGNRLVTASHDRTAAVWDTTTGQRICEMPHTGMVLTAAYAPDGRTVATAAWDWTVHLWDAGGTLLHVLRGHRAKVNAVAFSPDGRTLASAGEDGTVRLWHVGLGREMLALHVGTPCLCLSFRRDGRVLAAGARDGTVHFWWTDPR
jgi:WD40 repeat protein/serine/threonine protein kinase